MDPKTLIALGVIAVVLLFGVIYIVSNIGNILPDIGKMVDKYNPMKQQKKMMNDGLKIAKDVVTSKEFKEGAKETGKVVEDVAVKGIKVVDDVSKETGKVIKDVVEGSGSVVKNMPNPFDKGKIKNLFDDDKLKDIFDKGTKKIKNPKKWFK